MPPGRRKEALTADRPPGRFGLPEEFQPWRSAGVDECS